MRNAVILAGGRGARMWPFADVRNKVSLPVAGTPNVRRLADALIGIGIERVAVVLGPEAGSVRNALLGVGDAVRFVEQPSGGGTAGAALAGLSVLPPGRALIVAGDTWLTIADLAAVAGAPRATGAPGAVLIDAMPAGDAGSWYGVQADEHRIRGVIGHDSDASLRLCGVLAVDETFAPILQANPGRMLSVPVGGMPPAEPDIAQSILDWRSEIAVVRASAPVVDMDKPWHLLQANLLAAELETGALEADDIHPTARIHDGAEIAGHVRIGAGSVIGPRVVIEGNTIIGASTRVTNGAILRGANVIGSGTRVSDYCLLDHRGIVGSNCVLGHGAEMDGLMMDGSYLYHYCEICGVVGVSVDIGAATVCGTLRFDDGPAEHRVCGRRERPVCEANGTYFGDFCRTGVNVITMPGTKIGAHTCVGAGIVVSGDVPSGQLLIQKQEVVTRPWGPNRYGW